MVCPRTSQRIYLSLNVEKRSQISEYFTIYCPFDGETHEYRRIDVVAEPILGASVGGTIIGGLIGAIVAGPLGAILVGGAGLVTGSRAEQEERLRVQRFEEG